VVESGSHKLILSSGSPNEFELLRSEVIIGRDSSADLSIPSPAVSRRHARVIREGAGYALEDLGSSNGTFLNGERLTARHSLKSGDQIRGKQLLLPIKRLL
jgi:pSer/pThr/pTyr-binding forkhead associated (FHA) protein